VSITLFSHNGPMRREDNYSHGRSQNFWLGGSCAVGAPKLTEFFSHKWLVWCVEPFQGRNYRGVLGVKTCCMPKIVVFCLPCKNWEGRTTYTTYVTALTFCLLGKDLLILALLLMCIYFRHLLFFTTIFFHWTRRVWHHTSSLSLNHKCRSSVNYGGKTFCLKIYVW